MIVWRICCAALLSALTANLDAATASGVTSAEALVPSGVAIGVVASISDITRRVELDRMKTEPLQLVSHELRAPLTSIHGLSDVLIKFPVAADEANEMLRTIHCLSSRPSAGFVSALRSGSPRRSCKPTRNS